ncbi:GFA family protein [Vannielia litorea]|nr:GFA family protein [Vannielia litorea]
MSSGLAGRCLCGAVTYDTGAEPLWVTICYCTFCQRATGSDRMIEPVFDIAGFRFTEAQPSVFALLSEGSGKEVCVHFCQTYGTKLALTFERWPDRIGIYLGTLEEPSALAMSPEKTKHISPRRRGRAPSCRPVSRPTRGMPRRLTGRPGSRSSTGWPPSLADEAHGAGEGGGPNAKGPRCGPLR